MTDSTNGREYDVQPEGFLGNPLPPADVHDPAWEAHQAARRRRHPERLGRPLSMAERQEQRRNVAMLREVMARRRRIERVLGAQPESVRQQFVGRTYIDIKRDAAFHALATQWLREHVAIPQVARARERQAAPSRARSGSSSRTSSSDPGDGSSEPPLDLAHAAVFERLRAAFPELAPSELWPVFDALPPRRRQDAWMALRVEAEGVRARSSASASPSATVSASSSPRSRATSGRASTRYAARPAAAWGRSSSRSARPIA